MRSVEYPNSGRASGTSVGGDGGIVEIELHGAFHVSDEFWPKVLLNLAVDNKGNGSLILDIVDLELLQIAYESMIASSKRLLAEESELGGSKIRLGSQCLDAIGEDGVVDVAARFREKAMLFGVAVGILKPELNVAQVKHVLGADHLEELLDVFVADLLGLRDPEWRVSLPVSVEDELVLAIENATTFIMDLLASV